MELPLLKEADVKGKRVFLLADLDAPLSQTRKIEDDTRLKSCLPTVEYLLQKGATVILAGKLGRPKGVDKSLSLEVVAHWFSIKYKALNIEYRKIGEFAGWEIMPQLFLLENLRFFKGEEANNEEFAKKLASLADIYVNDAFAMCHRNHASIVGIPKFLPHFAGFHLEQEIARLNSAMQNPKRPLVVVIGGKKIETKLPLVEKMHRIADYVLVGGKIAQESKTLAKVQHEKIGGKKSVLLVADLTPDGMGITQKSLDNFIDIISLAKTIIWNGTMGKINEKLKMKNEKFAELDDLNHATRKIAQAIIDSKAYSVVGGGDTVEFLNRIKILDKFSFASTGGGAMLAYLSGEKLPGIEALKQ